jgi:hypothetical protein
MEIVSQDEEVIESDTYLTCADVLSSKTLSFSDDHLHSISHPNVLHDILLDLIEIIGSTRWVEFRTIYIRFAKNTQVNYPIPMVSPNNSLF